MHDLRINTDASLPWSFAYIEGADLILQRVRVRLRTFLGEWQLDTAKGLPFLAWAQQKPPNVGAIGAAIRAEVLAVPGVIRFETFAGTFDRTAQRLQYDGIVILEDEQEAALTVLPFGAEGNASTAVITVAVSPIVEPFEGIAAGGF